MPTKIGSKEVLTYLNFLGYKNIDAQQLKEFMQDLKKLIKYEEQRKFRDVSDSDSSHSSQGTLYKSPPKKKCNDDIFEVLYSRGTVESKAKVTPKKEKVISVQIKKSQTACSHKQSSLKVSADRTKENVEVEAQKPPEIKEQVDKQIQVGRKTGNKVRKPKASFIRSSVKVNMKSDPVALYHKYQEEWKRHKIPGEDNRAELRWVIREQMLGGPKM